jgi:5-methylcytosine-specific restriction enzyme subunit McrC
MIAVKNLYFLLLYAWDAFDEGRMTAIDAEPETDLLNLLASVLTRGVDQLLRRGPDQGYLPRTEMIPGIRGKLDLSATVKANLIPRARTVCALDELSHDIPHNQILKATLHQLLRSNPLDAKLRDPVRTAYLRLPGISDIRLSERAFRAVQLHRNIRFYRFLLDVCRLLYRCLIPDEKTGASRFRDFTRNERRMHRLFERFLYNFYRHEQTTFRVRRSCFKWAGATGPDRSLLPTMNTDLTLTRPGRFLVIEAKYTPNVLQHHPQGSPTLRSGHLYQLFAYLKNLPIPAETTLDGLLIYPMANRRLDLMYTLHGHRIRIYTLDLGQHWRMIRRDLLALVVPSGPT